MADKGNWQLTEILAKLAEQKKEMDEKLMGIENLQPKTSCTPSQSSRDIKIEEMPGVYSIICNEKKAEYLRPKLLFIY
ncbi:uncharacterized protein LOC143043563 isoform X2 [Mytilus galloprovincialis]|uniref:uncharacterized protein LOC143043563 isoform X2 n=1 Tax=Mytilus galloprovincialis TaxID=29158 RepID=UPI003F7B9C9A